MTVGGGGFDVTVVAIDGPGGVGKSTVAAALAARLGVPHIDTGAIYRAAALAVLRAGVSPDDAGACAAVAAEADIRRAGARTLLDGDDVEDVIRGPEVTAVVSQVSAHPAVRLALLGQQRAGLEHGGVVEGRDAGTAVVPDAHLKVWLTASPEVRATRRAAQVGVTDPTAVTHLAEELAQRDASDAERMRPAADAIIVDTGAWAVDDLVADLAARAVAGTSATRSKERE